MEAFENIDDLFRGLQHFLTPYTIYIAIFALLCLAGAIVFFCMYRSWKSAWKTDWKYFDDLLETTHKQHNADLADLRAENKTWKESSNQLKNELKRLEVADLKAINGLLDKINEVKERYHTSCDKGVEQLDQIDDLRDQLAKSENRIACSEGKYSKVNTKLIAMDYAVDIFKKMDVEETLEEIFDGIYSRIKKD
jgi:chromosome segregation ATPase